MRWTSPPRPGGRATTAIAVGLAGAYLGSVFVPLGEEPVAVPIGAGMALLLAAVPLRARTTWGRVEALLLWPLAALLGVGLGSWLLVHEVGVRSDALRILALPPRGLQDADLALVAARAAVAAVLLTPLVLATAAVERRPGHDAGDALTLAAAAWLAVVAAGSSALGLAAERVYGTPLGAFHLGWALRLAVAALTAGAALRVILRDRARARWVRAVLADEDPGWTAFEQPHQADDDGTLPLVAGLDGALALRPRTAGGGPFRRAAGEAAARLPRDAAELAAVLRRRARRAWIVAGAASACAAAVALTWAQHGPALSGVVGAIVRWDLRCFLLADGTVRCAGGNARGELGDGTTRPRAYPVEVPGVVAAVQMVDGHDRICVLDRSREVRCWGGSAQRRVPELSGATRITLGSRDLCGLRDDGAVVCVGEGGAGPTERARDIAGDWRLDGQGLRRPQDAFPWDAASCDPLLPRAPGEPDTVPGSLRVGASPGTSVCDVKVDGSVRCLAMNQGKAGYRCVGPFVLRAPEPLVAAVSFAGGACGIDGHARLWCLRGDDPGALAREGVRGVSEDGNCLLRADGTAECVSARAYSEWPRSGRGWVARR